MPLQLLLNCGDHSPKIAEDEDDWRCSPGTSGEPRILQPCCTAGDDRAVGDSFPSRSLQPFWLGFASAPASEGRQSALPCSGRSYRPQATWARNQTYNEPSLWVGGQFAKIPTMVFLPAGGSLLNMCFITEQAGTGSSPATSLGDAV